jgi:hypothetical protein
MKKKAGEIVGGLLWAVLFIGVGAVMIVNPDLGGYEPHGRHLLIKQIVAWVWSMPAGIVGVLVGLLMLWGTFLGDSKEQGAEEGS